MERAFSCYLPPSCYSPPLSKLSVGSWASLPLHLLNPGPAQLSSAPVPHQVLLLLFSIWATTHGLIQLRIPCQLLPWFCMRKTAAAKRVTTALAQHAHFICWNSFCKSYYRQKTKNPCSRMLARKIVPSTNMLARKFFFFFPPLLTPVLLYWKLSLQQDAGQTNTRPQAS